MNVRGVIKMACLGLLIILVAFCYISSICVVIQLLVNYGVEPPVRGYVVAGYMLSALFFPAYYYRIFGGKQ
jgi:hypothetical protein